MHWLGKHNITTKKRLTLNLGNFILKTSATRYPQVTHYVMSRSGQLRKGDSTTHNLENAKGVKGDALKEETFPEEMKDSQSLVHCVGALIPGKSYETSYEALNRDSAIHIAKKFNEYAKLHDQKRNFVLISSEKAPPFLGNYTTTKREAEDYILNECDNLKVHIIRPGFMVQSQDRPWSPPLACLLNIGYNLNQSVVQKTPLGSSLDFLFPAHSTPLEKVAEIAVEALHDKLSPQIWTNDMILNYKPSTQ